MDNVVDPRLLVRRPAGTWLYERGPRPQHRLYHPYRGSGVLARDTHLRAAARRLAGSRWATSAR